MNIYLELLFLVLCATIHTSAGNKSRQDVLKQILKNYDPDVYPNDREGNQTEVTVQMTIADIDQINDQSEEFEMILYLRMEWYDPRLQFENETDISFTSIELTGDKTSKVWLPDLFFDYERKTSNHGIMGPEKLIYIYKDGNITFSERITMTTECVMDLKNFPFDEQNCILHLESYAYTTRSLVLKWAEPNDVAVQNLDTNTPYFTVTQIKTTSGVNMWSSFSIYQENRNFSFLNATLTLERISSVYGFTYFGTFPVYATMVLLSFGLKDTGPRVTACSSAIAAVGLQWIAVYSKLPPIPHYTVIDKWILGHMLFMWLAIVYHVLVHIWISTHQGKKARFNERSEASPSEKKGIEDTDVVKDAEKSTPSTPESANAPTENEGLKTTADKITHTVKEWIITFKIESGRKINHETGNTVKRSLVEFLILDEYLKAGKWSVAEHNDDLFITEMVKLLQPSNIESQKEDDKRSIMQSFIVDKKWKCPTLFNIWARIKIYLPCFGSCCECCRSCGSRLKELITSCLGWCSWLCEGMFDLCKEYYQKIPSCSSCCESCKCCCSCCKYKGYAFLQEQQSDQGRRVVKLEGQEDSFFSRSFEDFYYLQTYLQAKYPDYKWPKLPLHNVLTTDDQRNLQQTRTNYIKDMVKLLQPNFWKHHSKIEKIMQTFTTGEEWRGSKWYSYTRFYILNVVDSEGHKTGPDLLAFIFFSFGYCLFVTLLLHDKWENGGQLFYEVVPCAFALAVFVIIAKYISMMPSKLWHTNAGLEKDLNKPEKGKMPKNSAGAKDTNARFKRNKNKPEKLEMSQQSAGAKKTAINENTALLNNEQ